MIPKLLIIQTAFIGDVVLATALIENCHARFPGAQIDFLVRKGNEELLNGHPYLQEVLIWDKRKNKIRHLLQLILLLRRKKYDKVINVQRYFATGLLTAFSGAAETIGFDKNPLSFLFTKKIRHVFDGYPGKEKDPSSPKKISGHYLHETERNNLLIEPFTQQPARRPVLYPSEKHYTAVSQYQSATYITLSPSSVWFTKQYPAEKWISFINRVPASCPVYLLGGPGDTSQAELIRMQSAHPNMTNLCGKLNFLESAALMKKAVMNYVNDSAPMHFASAVNAPVTAIFCSTIPAFGYGPLSDTRFIVERKEPLYCRPCGIHGHKACPQSHFKCAVEITDDQLLETFTPER
ncbi:MAG: glycosyltransferase family 9 protein [Flavitalea sp.]